MFENSEKLIIVLALALLFLGPSKMAGLGGTLGRAIRDFRKSVREAQDTFSSSMHEAQETMHDARETLTAAEQSVAETPAPQALPAPGEPALQTFPAADSGGLPAASSPEAVPAVGTADGSGAQGREAESAADDFEGPHSLASEPPAEAVREGVPRPN